MLYVTKENWQRFSRNRLLFTVMYEIKTRDANENFIKYKEMFDFSNYAAKSKYYDDSNNVVVGKKKEETIVLVIEGFVGLKPKMYSFLIDDSSDHKKTEVCE